ncbi:triple tyrosine motif-containing protein [Undibacterium sp. Ji49W]|uniref:triple tyrosine motif-containing protein n=1 Tax=Undibacterium sp. Ji49W TaxID=3413040 RepID=UPI003BF3AD7A
MKSLLLDYCHVAVACCVLFCCGVFPAVSLSQGLAAPAINLHHTSWSARDGAPESILSITQTSDGWLWLGGPAGLYRFDGMQFEQFAPVNAALPTQNVSLVNAVADGGLWIGYRSGGASFLRHGLIRNYGVQDGLPNRAVWGLEQDGSGRMWAATTLGLFYMERDHWQKPASSWGLAGGPYKTLMRDRHGVLWAQGDAGVYSLKPGETRFAKAAVDRGTGVLFELPNGNVVSWDALHGRLNLLTGPRQNTVYRQWGSIGDPGSLLIDRHGDLWVGLLDGLELHTARRITRATPRQGLSGRAVGAIFEDQEGNIWTSTSSGIDRFRHKRLTKLEVPEAAIGGGIIADDSAGVWIGSYHVVANEIGQATATPLLPQAGDGWDRRLTSFTRTSDGALWGASYGTLRRFQGAGSRSIALPAAIGGVRVQALQADKDDSLLVALLQHGLYRRRPQGTWEKAGSEGEVNVMARSDTTGLWLGYYPGLVVHAQGAAWRSYGAAEGLALGTVMALHLHGQHVWAGGEKGLALFGADHFRQISGVNGETFRGISGIVELENGDLWLNAFAGLFRIPGSEIAQFERQRDYHVQYERLDQLDGLEGSAPYIAPTPSLVLASDLRLWIARSTGMFLMNPAESLPPAPKRPVIIKALGPPGNGRPPQLPIRFAPGSSVLQFDYTSPALSIPERMRFRYRLEEVDTEWQDAGGRRNAYYSNLAPGNYRFSVTSTDYNGKWSDIITTVDFVIAPKATQTWWFKALCVLSLLTVAHIAYRWHIRRLGRQMVGRLQERVNERERIARELHDTLLQSVQGLVLHVHAALLKLPARDTARLQIETALQQADEVLDEGRERIRELRGEDAGKVSFADAVLAAAARLQHGDAGPIHLTISDSARQLNVTIYEDALAIVTEAVANAYTHARATRIEVEIHYGKREFRCILRDDGVGIPAAVLNDGGRQNHWGMCGMYERAARIKAKLVVHSREGSGTVWQLDVPAALAYTR